MILLSSPTSYILNKIWYSINVFPLLCLLIYYKYAQGTEISVPKYIFISAFLAASPLARAIYHQFSLEKYPDSAWYVCDVCACVILQVLNAYIQSSIKMSFLSFSVASATSRPAFS